MCKIRILELKQVGILELKQVNKYSCEKVESSDPFILQGTIIIFI